MISLVMHVACVVAATSLFVATLNTLEMTCHASCCVPGGGGTGARLAIGDAPPQESWATKTKTARAVAWASCPGKLPGQPMRSRDHGEAEHAAVTV